MQSGFFSSLDKGSAMQQPSPTQSSPSTGLMGGPRSSPLFSSAVDQPDPPPPTGQYVGRYVFAHSYSFPASSTEILVEVLVYSVFQSLIF